MLNWLFYMLYKLMRLYYVSFYVYFQPFLSVILSLGIPLFYCFVTDCPTNE